MLSKMKVWWYCVMVSVCVNITFGRCCPCNKGKDKNNEKKKGVLYYKIVPDKEKGEVDISKVFSQNWYKERKGGVVQLVESDEDVEGNDVLKVSGKGNNWKIKDTKSNGLQNVGCTPSNNTWIIVNFTTLNEGTGNAGNSFIFYVDNISTFKNKKDNIFCSVFDWKRCYSIDILAANTENVMNMSFMFFNVNSALERDGKEESGSGLRGLDKLNVTNVESIRGMFLDAIYKKITLAQLSGWEFGKEKVDIRSLFYSKSDNLDFSDFWKELETKYVGKPFLFYATSVYGNGDLPRKAVFFENSYAVTDINTKLPTWWKHIQVK